METIPDYLRLSKVRFETLEARRLLTAIAASASEGATYIAVTAGGGGTIIVGKHDGTTASGVIQWTASGDGPVGPVTLSDGTTLVPTPITTADGTTFYRFQFVDADGNPIAAPPPPAPTPSSPASRAESDIEATLGTVVQADGKVLVATLLGERNTSDAFGSSQTFDRIAIVRYNADGSLDASFGTGGYRAYTIGQDTIASYWRGAVVQDAAGGLLVGYSNGIKRFNADGSIDTAFGTHGTVAANGGIEKLKVQADGKIVVELAANTILRLNADGSADTSFTPYHLEIPGSLWGGAEIHDFDVAADGSIYVVGEIRSNLDGQNVRMTTAYLAKLNADGTPDTSFGTGGRFELDDPGRRWEAFRGVVALADGTVQVVGNYSNVGSFPTESGTLFARFNADGTPVASYGAGGVIRDSVLQLDDLGGVAELADGRIVASTYGNSGARLIVADADGSNRRTVEQAIDLPGDDPFLSYTSTWTSAPVVAPDGTIVVGVAMSEMNQQRDRDASETYWSRIDLDAPSPPAPDPVEATPPPTDASPGWVGEDEVIDDGATEAGGGVADDVPSAEDDAPAEGGIPALQFATPSAAASAVRTGTWFAIAGTIGDGGKDDPLAPAADDVLA